ATVKSIRQGELQPGISRIVIDFQNPIKIHNAYILPRDAAHNKPDRLVVDFQNVSADVAAAAAAQTFGKLSTPGMTATLASATTTSAPTPASAPIMENPARDTIAVATPDTAPTVQLAALTPDRKPAQDTPFKSPAPHKKPLIVIDAGHGGVDPGALGANGVAEKHVTLNMAKTLKEQLEATGRYRVLLTREGDKYLKLYKRVEFARQNHADLFISLHADSIGKSNVAGASLYTLSDKASDEQTALLADRENRADLIAGMDLDTSDEQVATILVDLTMRDTMNQSKFFANKLVNHMQNGNIKMLENPHRHAGFAVLKAPDTPSILVEMGFMSNPREAEQLTKPEYRRNFARTLVQGIDNYFAKLAQMQRS
ncbi:MAG TPA: N-acetylmuramoyl-L-alanine amidase, partial [Micavibrio sp.]